MSGLCLTHRTAMRNKGVNKSPWTGSLQRAIDWFYWGWSTIRIMGSRISRLTSTDQGVLDFRDPLMSSDHTMTSSPLTTQSLLTLSLHTCPTITGRSFFFFTMNIPRLHRCVHYRTFQAGVAYCLTAAALWVYTLHSRLRPTAFIESVCFAYVLIICSILTNSFCGYIFSLAAGYMTDTFCLSAVDYVWHSHCILLYFIILYQTLCSTGVAIILAYKF